MIKIIHFKQNKYLEQVGSQLNSQSDYKPAWHLAMHCCSTSDDPCL